MKRGITGPSCCALCKTESESLVHLFLECDFTKALWEMILQEMLFPISLKPNSFKHIFSKRGIAYPGFLKRKPLIKVIWNNFPGSVLCKIWINRKSLVFNDKEKSLI